MTVAYYLSHPQVQIDPAVPVPEWGLSDAGRARPASDRPHSGTGTAGSICTCGCER